MPEKLNIGILGTANIAMRSVIPAMQQLPEMFNLVGIASRTGEKADQAAEQFNTNAFHSYDEIFNLPGLDALYIPLPNSMHNTWVQKAMNKGIHVLVEKSMGLDLNEVKDMCSLAKDNDLALVENFQFKTHIQLQKIQDILSSGRIGELRCMRASFGFPPFPDKGNIRYQKKLGGGALLDAGAYPTKVSQILLGSDLVATSSSLTYDRDSEVDIWGGAFLKQKNGDLFSEIAFGFDHYYQCGIELWGSQGKLTTNRLFTARADFEPIIHLQTNLGDEDIVVEKDDHFCNMLKHFYNVCRNSELKEVEYNENMHQARLLEEIKKNSH